MTKILLLAGTAEARALSKRLATLPAIEAIASLAGETAAPAPYAISVRTGGFGGAHGLGKWLSANQIAALIDATHPYAEQMQANAAAAAEATGIPRLRLLRPPWPRREGWVDVPDLAAAAQALPAGARALLTTGRKEVAPFAARTDVTCILRTIEPVGGLPPHIANVTARPPFTIAQETETLCRHGITHLVTKNAGGAGTAKLDAADALRLSTIVIARPPPAPGPTARTPDEAIAWLRETVLFGRSPPGHDDAA